MLWTKKRQKRRRLLKHWSICSSETQYEIPMFAVLHNGSSVRRNFVWNQICNVFNVCFPVVSCWCKMWGTVMQSESVWAMYVGSAAFFVISALTVSYLVFAVIFWIWLIGQHCSLSLRGSIDWLAAYWKLVLLNDVWICMRNVRLAW